MQVGGSNSTEWWCSLIMQEGLSSSRGSWKFELQPFVNRYTMEVPNMYLTLQNMYLYMYLT